MRIRDAIPQDFAAIHALVAGAFRSEDEARLIDNLRRDGDSVIDIVADDAGRITGHALFSTLQAPFSALALAPVAVETASRNKGIASALIRHGLADAKLSGWRGVFVLGDPDFYARFGFEADLAKGFVSPYAGPHFMAVALGGPLAVQEGAVVHARAFAALG